MVSKGRAGQGKGEGLQPVGRRISLSRHMHSASRQEWAAQPVSRRYRRRSRGDRLPERWQMCSCCLQRLKTHSIAVVQARLKAAHGCVRVDNSPLSPEPAAGQRRPRYLRSQTSWGRLNNPFRTPVFMSELKDAGCPCAVRRLAWLAWKRTTLAFGFVIERAGLLMQALVPDILKPPAFTRFLAGSGLHPAWVSEFIAFSPAISGRPASSDTGRIPAGLPPLGLAGEFLCRRSGLDAAGQLVAAASAGLKSLSLQHFRF